MLIEPVSHAQATVLDSTLFASCCQHADLLLSAKGTRDTCHTKCAVHHRFLTKWCSISDGYDCRLVSGEVASGGKLRIAEGAAQVQAPLAELELAQASRQDTIRVCI